MGAFHRQKLKKAVVSISVDEDYDINDVGCYRIRRLEKKLFGKYLPVDYPCEDIITYQWQQNREYNLQGHFNFYYSIAKESVSRASMFFYMVLLLTISLVSELLGALIQNLIGL